MLLDPTPEGPRVNFVFGPPVGGLFYTVARMLYASFTHLPFKDRSYRMTERVIDHQFMAIDVFLPPESRHWVSLWPLPDVERQSPRFQTDCVIKYIQRVGADAPTVIAEEQINFDCLDMGVYHIRKYMEYGVLPDGSVIEIPRTPVLPLS